MNITNFEDLRYWFFGNEKATNEQSPHWSLYSMDYGKSDTRVMFNNRISDMEESFQALVKSIKIQNNPDGTRFRVQTHPVGKPNNPTANTFVEVYEKGAQNAQAGIGSLPAASGYVSRDEIAKMLKDEREKWEMKREIEDLKAAINAPPSDWTEKLMAGIERIGQTPLGAMMVAKITGLPIPTPEQMAQMNGVPSASTDDGSAADSFDENMDFLSEKLGISDTVMVAKLRRFVEHDPATAKAFLQQL
jgi:hypothetical protein